MAAKLARQLWSSEFAAQLFLSVTVTAKPCPVSVQKKPQRKSPFGFSATILKLNADAGKAVSREQRGHGDALTSGRRWTDGRATLTVSDSRLF